VKVTFLDIAIDYCKHLYNFIIITTLFSFQEESKNGIMCITASGFEIEGIEENSNRIRVSKEGKQNRSHCADQYQSRYH
jgi:hypothetical protein